MAHNRKVESKSGKLTAHLDQLRAGLRDMAEAGTPFRELVPVLQRVYCEEAVRACKGNVTAAAKLIEAHRNTVMRHAGGRRDWGLREAEKVVHGRFTDRDV